METITFTITRMEGLAAYGTLAWTSKNLSSPAISGPFDKGNLPIGDYIAKRSKLLDKPGQAPYTDAKGNAWMQGIDPKVSNNRNNLGIHPDGNTSGTEGCIGLKVENTISWYDAFKASNEDISIVVQ
jgi:hypothetical protein